MKSNFVLSMFIGLASVSFLFNPLKDAAFGSAVFFLEDGQDGISGQKGINGQDGGNGETGGNNFFGHGGNGGNGGDAE